MGGVTHLLLLLWVGVTVSTAVDLQKRIIGGTKCGDDERLYHVKLVDKNENLTCGGSLITNQWVLTAAHCERAGATKVILGVHPGPDKTIQTQVRSVIFVKNEKQHDIMLWKLTDPTNIAPVKLPDCTKRPSPTKKDKVQIAGHAITATGPYNNRIPGESSDLQCSDVDVVACPWLSNPSSNPKRHESTFCGETSGVDVCHLQVCRNQVLRCVSVTYYLDGAHTTVSMQACVLWFRQETLQRDQAQYDDTNNTAV